MKSDNVIRILFVEDKVEDAEEVISLLRNHGIAVRPERVTNEGELEAAAQRFTPDLVLINPDVRDLDTANVISTLEATGKDFAPVGIVKHMDDDTVTRLFAQGVHGLALRSRPEQLVQVVRREFESLGMRRSVRRLKQSLRESERRCDALLASSRDPIAYVHEGVHVRANQAYLDIFGYESFEDIEGLTLLDMVGADHASDFKDLLKRMSRGEKPPQHVELTAVRADGGSFEASMEFSQATFEGEACLQIVFRSQVVDEELKEQLQLDPATGLYHRTRMLELIDEAVSAASDGKREQAMLLLEADNWQSVVGAIGMGQADALMAAIATRVRDNLNEHAVAGRMGEHTLGVLLDHHGDSQVRQQVDRLLELARDAVFEVGTHSLALTFGIGVSLLGERNANTQQLLEQAHEALRAAQSRGIGSSQIHDPAAHDKAEAERDLQWLGMVKQALDDDAFVLYNQQIASLQDAEGVYAEALLRMEGPNGEVTPGYFLPVAERNGLMPAVDRWVIGKAIDVLASGGRNAPTVLFVKLSAMTMQDPTLIDWLKHALQGKSLAAGALVLEMPESKVLTSLKPAQEFVTGIKALGVSFALERFGSGLNSFQLLQHVDADYLKLDHQFMDELAQHDENRAKVAEICRQAHAQGKLTIAEWVEDASSTSILFGCGVDFVQGFFLHQPERLAVPA